MSVSLQAKLHDYQLMSNASLVSVHMTILFRLAIIFYHFKWQGRIQTSRQTL